METGDMLLRAILEDPADDAPRLIYADWLEEHGQGARADFIRVQVELEGTPERLPAGSIITGHGPHIISMDGQTLGVTDAPVGMLMQPIVNPRWQHLKDREFALLFRTAFWGVDLPVPAIPTTGYCTWTRGFLSGIRLRSEEFMQYAAAIFAAHPVTEVEWMDITLPVPRGGTIFTVTQRHPPDYEGRFNHLDARLRIRASDSISTACVRHGRMLAGLPCLPCGGTGSVVADDDGFMQGTRRCEDCQPPPWTNERIDPLYSSRQPIRRLIPRHEP